MITAEHMAALKDLVATETRVATYVADATGGAYPRIILTPAYARLWERMLSDDIAQVEQDLRVTSVGETLDAALRVAERARQCLSPSLGARRVPVPGWSTWSRHVRTEMTDVDRDATITGTDTHPVIVVDTIHVSSVKNR